MLEESKLASALAGRYDLEREIGIGGMATVYLATDVRHHRKVALKVLRPELAVVIGAERFLAEIRTTANLQHPHILPLHDSGEADGTVFYVMPFVEGESLRDRIEREKQLPIDDAMRITAQVAAALDYAHRRHVIHRDIKPENILLADGQALVADFGIALAVSRSDGSTRMTETGLSLGTPRYMAPEQAMGERDITAKADIYSLGCVLYEMLSGEPPFTGATAQAIVARVMTENPRSLTSQRHTIARHVEAAVATALEKLPADRFATAGEFASALVDSSYGAADTNGRVNDRSDRRATRGLVGSAVGVAIAALLALGWSLTRSSPPRPVTRTGLAFAAGQGPLEDRHFVLAPDGSRLAYIGPADQASGQLWLKERDRFEATPVPGTAGAVSFTFSPNGRSLAFVTPGAVLRTIAIGGGGPTTLADSAGPIRGVAWLDNGTIVFAGPQGHALKRIPEGGGTSEKIWSSDTSNAFIADPLPNGRGLLFVQCSGPGCTSSTPQAYALPLPSGAPHRLISGISGLRYVPTGNLIYVGGDGQLMAIPFSLRSLSTTGSAVPLATGISASVEGYALFDVSRDGTLITRSGPPGASRGSYELVLVDRAGHESPVDSGWVFRLTLSGSNAGWSLSPDGTRLAIGLNGGTGDGIWIKQLPHGPLSRLSFDNAPEFRPRWTSDGRSVMFVSLRLNTGALFSRSADATGTDTLMFPAIVDVNEAQMSADGRYVVVRNGGTSALSGGRDISVLRIGVDSVPRPLIATPFDEYAFALSPDGRWIAYESNETGRPEIFIRPFPAADAGKWQVSTNGGSAPLWNRNSRELFYVNGDRSMVVVPVATGSTPALGARKTLFHLREALYLSDPEFYTPYDIMPDGQRFIMARQVGYASAMVSPPLVMVQNWFEELRAKLPHK